MLRRSSASGAVQKFEEPNPALADWPIMPHRGVASTDEQKQHEIASNGVPNVPDEKLGFSKDHELAAEAGRKGGQAVAAAPRLAAIETKGLAVDACSCAPLGALRIPI
jgi:general stress protein YciG